MQVVGATQSLAGRKVTAKATCQGSSETIFALFDPFVVTVNRMMHALSFCQRTIDLSRA